ncbi:MAG: HlyD family efflux transporter periplasmic adaptor subunit [Mesorhizobium sp.]
MNARNGAASTSRAIFVWNGSEDPAQKTQSHKDAPASAWPQTPSVEPARQDAAALQSLLDRQFSDGENIDAPAAAKTAVKPLAISPSPSHLKSRLLKSLAGLALVATVGWMPTERLFQVSSVEAVVNARVVTFRAPINGIVDANRTLLRAGQTVSAGAPLGSLSNPRVDRNGVNNAADRLQQAQDERTGLAAKLNAYKSLRANLESRLASFHANRLLLINAQIVEADARIASAAAIQKRAEAALRRQTTLKVKGVLSLSAIDDAIRDADVAAAATNEARARRAALAVEADALNGGSFFGDSYNDQPQSAQRIDEIDQSIASLQAEIITQDQRIVGDRATLAREQETLSLASEAHMVAPAAGRIWEILAAPGEQVVAGQELGSVLDCSQVVVTAAVSEAVYNSLSVGMPASFTFREGGPALPGRVSQLSGVASASSNFAILPSALTKESYRVAVAVDGASPDGSCAVGRTGRVVFQISAH